MDGRNVCAGAIAAVALGGVVSTGMAAEDERRSSEFRSAKEAREAVRRAGPLGLLLIDRGLRVHADPSCGKPGRPERTVFEEQITIDGKRVTIGYTCFAPFDGGASGP